MSLVHLHLLLNHVPIIGMIFVAFVLAGALWSRNRGMSRLGLLMLTGIGAIAVIVFLTGEPAEEAVEHLAGVRESAIHDHEEAAEIAFIGSSITGVAALLLLAWSYRRDVSRSLQIGVLVLVVAVSGLMARVAYLGGQIRHSEIGDRIVSGERSDDDR